MKQMDDRWQRLVTAARRDASADGVVVPTGFATRVVAHAMGIRRSHDHTLERLAVRMMGVSCLIALFAVITYFAVGTPAVASSESDTLFHLEDPASLFVGEISHD